MGGAGATTPHVRPIDDAEHELFMGVHLRAFNEHPKPEERERLAVALADPAVRRFGAFVGDELIGTGADIALELTLPDGGRADMLGLTFIGVLPNHRRQGVLRALMAEHEAEARRRGVALSGLFATSSALYGRYGYAPATTAAAYAIDTVRAAVVRGPEPAPVRLLPLAEAGDAIATAWDRFRRIRPGATSRPASEVGWLTSEPDRFAACAGDDGYAIYRVERTWPRGHAEHEVQVDQLVAATDAAYVALWRHLLELDLVARVVAENRPVDEPLRHLLAEPRRLDTTRVDDGLWLRVLDPARALAARPGLLDALGAIEVDGVVHGRGEAAIALDARTLGGLLLGGYAPSARAIAGGIAEVAAGGLARADRAFATGIAPWCPFDF